MTEKKSKKSPLKAKFRSSKVWRDFRKEMMVKQKNIDPITGSKLLSKCNLHHRLQDLDLDEYKDISNPENFVMINSQTHDCIHYMLRYIKKEGWAFVERLEKELKLEAEMNGYI